MLPSNLPNRSPCGFGRFIQRNGEPNGPARIGVSRSSVAVLFSGMIRRFLPLTNLRFVGLKISGLPDTNSHFMRSLRLPPVQDSDRGSTMRLCSTSLTSNQCLGSLKRSMPQCGDLPATALADFSFGFDLSPLLALSPEVHGIAATDDQISTSSKLISRLPVLFLLAPF